MSTRNLPAQAALNLRRRHFNLAACRTLTAATVGAILGPAAFAQGSSTGYPSRPIRTIVPFPPGGPIDFAGRTVSQKLAERYGQPVVVDNRAGAGGIVGAEVAVKTAPDGYNLFVCSLHHAVLPALRPNLPYDIERDFVPVAFGAMFPIVLLVHPSVPVKSVAELIAYDKAKPGQLSFASTGTGGGTHLAGELFNIKAGTRLLHVPYKGSGPAMTDLLSGHVQVFFADAPTALPHIKAGKVKVIAVASAKRSVLFPDLPTIAEAGLRDYEAYTWAAFVAPKGTPAEIVQRLNADIRQVLASPDIRRTFADAGAEPRQTTPAEMKQFLHSEIAKWGAVVKAANIKAD